MNESIMLLSQAGNPTDAVQLDIDFDRDIVAGARAVAAVAALLWVVYALVRNIMPGGRGGGQAMQMMMGQQSSAMKVVLAVIGIITLMDINLFVTITNFILDQLWSLKDMLSDNTLRQFD